MLGLLGALDPYKHKLNQTGGMLVDGDSAAISKDITDNDAGNVIRSPQTGEGQQKNQTNKNKILALRLLSGAL